MKIISKKIISMNIAAHLSLLCLSILALALSSYDIHLVHQKNMGLTKIQCLIQGRAMFRAEEYKTPIFWVGLHLSPNLLSNENDDICYDFSVIMSEMSEMNKFNPMGRTYWCILGGPKNETLALGEIEKYKNGEVIDCYLEKGIDNSKIRLMVHEYRSDSINYYVIFVSIIFIVYFFNGFIENCILL